MPSQKHPLPETLDGRDDEESSRQQNFRRRQRHRRPRHLPAGVHPLEDDVNNDDEDSEGIDPEDFPEFLRHLPADVQPIEDAVENDDEDSEGIDPDDLPELLVGIFKNVGKCDFDEFRPIT